jgi:HK97 family phage prohead protease
MEYIETKTNKYEGTLSKFSVQEGKREFIATITTNRVDRDGDVVDPKGMDIKKFQENPVIFLNHEAWELPIGKAEWLRKNTDGNGGSGIMAKGFISEKTDRAIEAFGLMQDGILTTTSIGFGISPGGAREPNEGEIKAFPGIKRMITKSELFEFSIVGIPSNTDAVIQQVSKASKLPDWLGVSENMVNISDIEEDVETKDMVEIKELVETEDVVEITDLVDIEKVAQEAKEQTIELHEITALGRVTE